MTPKSIRPSRGLSDDPLWYKDAVIYEARVRSFFDANGDGIGDFQGLRQKLDYLADLGVTAIWILPHYPSPGRDDGYDCADYTGVHPDVGTIEDFDEFVREAHRRGVRVITELVMNHTSDQHPWFQRARRAAPGSPERDFYVWSDDPDKYKDARIIFRDFEPSNWSWDPIAKSYYWHRFFAHQPDLNFENPAVHQAMFDTVDFWLARGVDGLRLDAVPYLYEEEGTNCENLPRTHVFLKKLRAHVDAKFPNRLLLAEANQWPEDAAAYFGNGDECHMNFHFPIMPRLFMSIHMEDRFPIIDILRQTPELHPTCQWGMFLRNHDELTLEMVTDEERDYMYRAYAHEQKMRINLGIRRRLAPLVSNDRKKMELLNGLLFSMPGTPILYYGDEIGMGDNVWLGDRNGVRTPMQWSADRNAGFSRANPQSLILPIIIDPEYHYEALNVEMQQSNGSSLLWWTKRLIALRKRYRAFGRGTVEFLHPSNPRVLAFIRQWEDETILVVANLSRHVQYAELDLAAFDGKVPVELMGKTRFPTVNGSQSYMLTLGGHDFYWFSIEVPRGATEGRPSLAGPINLLCTSVQSLLFGDERSLLDDALPTFLVGRGLADTSIVAAKVIESVTLTDGDEPLVYVLTRVEYGDQEPETFAIPLAVVAEAPPNASLVAGLQLPSGERKALVEATTETAARVLVEAATKGTTFAASSGKIVGGLVAGASLDTSTLGEPRVLGTDRLGVTIAYGDRAVLKLLYRVEEGTEPELEVARFFRGTETPITPRVLGFVERRVGRGEPATLALLEEYVVNEGTAWQQARSEVGRVYEYVLAQPADIAAPALPSASLLELAMLDPPAQHAEIAGAYRDWAVLLGRRTAELHIALARSEDPAFAPTAYSVMDQRSKYQSARNLVGRGLGSLRRALDTLPAGTRESAARLAAIEPQILARFEPILTTRIESLQVRGHGNLHLGRALFTGKDYMLIGAGGGRDRRLTERRRKRGALRDVGSMIRSFHYAAATSLLALRPEDQTRADPWGWLWQTWATAAYLRGYLETATGQPFLAPPPMLGVLLDAAIIEKAFAELRSEVAHRPEMAWIPIQGILRYIR
ncbi:MAG: maltose alpha-D-glucosyltransferase [Labilithrix sp.]|nr:maltose alpha-D-glucosyltransferase [Labilithrix sp.]MCW5814113.1 maltose alpha-D-glucosyltransferase [Labilithrix sp.]